MRARLRRRGSSGEALPSSEAEEAALEAEGASEASSGAGGGSGGGEDEASGDLCCSPSDIISKEFAMTVSGLWAHEDDSARRRER